MAFITRVIESIPTSVELRQANPIALPRPLHIGGAAAISPVAGIRSREISSRLSA